MSLTRGGKTGFDANIGDYAIQHLQISKSEYTLGMKVYCKLYILSKLNVT